MDDCEIIALYWKRSEDAISETASKYSRYCKSIANNILLNADDADECVNDTYLHTWQSIPPQNPTLFSAFLGKITRNLALNKYKQLNAVKRGGGQVKILLSELEDCIPSADSVEEAYQVGIAAQAISSFLHSIDTQSRIVFVRRYWYADSIATIGSRYQMSDSKVKSMLFRNRNKLRIYLEKEGIVL